METGKVEYAPDYESKHPRLPKDWGIIKAACADGTHRFLPDAPKCGCGETKNPEVERTRLEREVIEAAKARRQAEHRFDRRRGSLADTAQQLMIAEIAEDEAVDALIDFESKQQQIKK